MFLLSSDLLPDSNNLLKIIVKSSGKEPLEVEIAAFSTVGLRNKGRKTQI